MLKPSAPLQPDIALLIACSLPPGHLAIGSRVQSALKNTPNWDQLNQLASHHRIKPLIYPRFSEHAQRLVPNEHLDRLHDEFRSRAAHNLNLTAQLVKLAKAFARAAIPALPHKGPLLAQFAYGDVSLREFADLDFLVAPEDLPRAMAVLEANGYRLPEYLKWLSANALVRWTGEVPFKSAQNSTVDLHWRLTPPHYPLQLAPKVLWQSQTAIKIAGFPVPTLGPEALLLLLSVHGAKHCWEAIGWVADIAWLVDSQPNLDWRLAMEMAESTECKRPLLLAASLVRDVFEVELPGWVEAAVEQDKAIAPLQQRVISRWNSLSIHSPESPELFAFANAISRSRWDSFKHLAGVVLAPTEGDWKRRRLPEQLFWTYGIGRVPRLIYKYIRR